MRFRRYRRRLMLPIRPVRGWLRPPILGAGFLLSILILFCLFSVMMLLVWR